MQRNDKLGVLVSGQDGDQVVGLKDKAHPVPAKTGQRPPAQFRQIAPFQLHRALGGRIQGAVSAADRVEVQGGAVVQGDVTTKRLIVQEGGEINGLVRMSDLPSSP